METLAAWLVRQGLGETVASTLATTTATLVVIVLSLTANLIARRYVLRGLHRLFLRTRFSWDDTFVERRVFERLSHLAPAVVIHVSAPVALAGHDNLVAFARTGALIYMIVVGLTVLDAVLNVLHDIYRRFPISDRVQIKSFIQVAKILIYCVGAIFVLSNLLGKSPVVFFSGLGAFTAVLLFVFKDPILGLVAGIQLMSNQMVRQGDWIEMPKYGVDGDVIDVSLTTIKVQNWDKTISTVPSYALVSDSFRNWRGMSESGGRRIKRAVFIDMNSIKFCDEEMLARFKKIRFISEYIARKIEEVRQHNRAAEVDESVLVNGRRLTNVGTFRAYLESYLRNHPKIHQELTFLVRHLPPTPQGLPIEVYVFSNDQAWANYEAIQADIFDHILAVIPHFDLRVFQSPSGADLRELAPAR